jgi:acetolactate synthase-1/3 small subunit
MPYFGILQKLKKMNQEFTISAYSENAVGLLNRITIIFTRRRINIESLTVSESALHGIHKFTIVVKTTEDKVIKATKQIEKLVEVLKAFYHTKDEIIFQEIALYKVPTESLLKSNMIETIVRQSNARIIEITPEYTVIEKTGHEYETTKLFTDLNKYGVKQFTRSGRIAVTRSNVEFLEEFLNQREGK